MHILALDTAMGACSAALLGPDGITAFRHLLLARGHAEAIVPMIAEILAEAALTMADVGRIGVTLGPGTFTGVRVGIASARALTIGHDIPIGGITTLRAIAGNALIALKRESPAARLAVICDARRSEVYIQLFDSAAKEVTRPAVLTPADAADLIDASRVAPDHLYILGTGVEAVGPHLRARSVTAKILDKTDPLPDARSVAALVRDLPDNALGVPSPLYLRPPDAKLPQE